MTTATTTKTKQITLTDLAEAVNDLIDTCPRYVNPQDDGGSCVYYDPETDSRCLIGQALYNLTGLNVPTEFENVGIDNLLTYSNFRRHFGLEIPGDTDEDVNLANAIVGAQSMADSNYTWGRVEKIEV